MRNGRNAKSPAFQFYPGDFLADPKVGAMPTEAQGAYIRLLCYGWLDGSVPNDHSLLAPMCGLSPDAFERAWVTLQRCWNETSPGRLTNPRQERERAFQAAGRERLIAQAKAASDAAAAARAQSSQEPDRNQPGSRQDPEQAPPLRPTPYARSSTPDTLDPKPVLKEKPRAPRTGPHADLMRHWEAEWLTTRGTAYAVEAKDGVAVAAILKLAGGDLQEAKRRALRLLHNADAWLTQNASLPLLRSRWNQLAVEVANGARGGAVEPKGFQGIRDYMAQHHQGGHDERGA